MFGTSLILFNRGFTLFSIRLSKFTMSEKKHKLSEKDGPVKKAKLDETVQNDSDLVENIKKSRLSCAASIRDFKFNKKRVRVLTTAKDIPEEAKCIVYWMSRDQRVQGNPFYDYYILLYNFLKDNCIIFIFLNQSELLSSCSLF
nr:deoxyribodipyrimidine photo-lyase-like [Parasteatoda tepidariorum]